VLVSFTGDGAPGATFTVTCVSSVTGPLPTATGTGSPILVSGITNLVSQTITCQVAETNSYGVMGPCSTPASTTLFGASGEGDCTTTLPAPTKLSVATGEGSATLSWTGIPPELANCLQGYVVTPSGSGVQFESLGPWTTTVVHGLTDGTSVTFTVAAANGGGIFAASPSTAPIIIGAPAAPNAVKATKIAGNALRVSFTPPTGNGSAITGYGATCRSSNGGKARTTLSRTPRFAVKRLTPGKTYSCTAVAANSRGASPSSAPSARVKV